MYRKLVIQTLLLGVTLLAACIAQDAATAATAADSPDVVVNFAQNTPPIHLRQTAVAIRDGKPLVQHQYEMALADCKHTKYTPIPAADVAKLGRTYFDVWYQGTSMSVQADTWGFEIDSYTPCIFRTTHLSQHWLRRADLKAARYQEGKDANAHILRLDGPRKRLGVRKAVDTAADKEQEEKVKAMAVKMFDQTPYGAQIVEHAHGELYNAVGKQRVAGQMCTVYHDVVKHFCKWVQSEKWGFDNNPYVATSGGAYGGTPYVDTIHLWEKPLALDGGIGAYLTTQSFSVGKPFDKQVFAVPAHPH